MFSDWFSSHTMLFIMHIIRHFLRSSDKNYVVIAYYTIIDLKHWFWINDNWIVIDFEIPDVFMNLSSIDLEISLW